MATWDDVRSALMKLPETTEPTPWQWRIRKKLIAWERPLRKADLEALGEEPTDDPILAVRTPDLVAKRALVGSNPDVFVTTPHFDDYPAVLVRLDRADSEELTEVLVEAWITQAPKRLSKTYLEGKP